MFVSLINSTGMPALDAGSDFARARRAQRAARAARLEVIALDAVVGTVEPSPHFDRLGPVTIPRPQRPGPARARSMRVFALGSNPSPA